ncbi:hypothetical protein [Puia dinghuensis]|uniref:Uncharacterized protein n=1 Tax=Puia dinghuensis TaxID=1792502 RepID=A0A8J2UFB3_9BACT|nr:hypothetical protein [Puia dinghuensis]GGB09145.1 hypothetical protein GCM10011511_35870 [Puia dinghuensis]
MITKENYYDYFLLYIDNELPPAARAAVEKFVGDNPQLQEEWEALLQCRVDPDEQEVFHSKEVLFQEDLLSYVDGELGEERRKEVEAFVHRHPSKALELQQLSMTVSEADLSVSFPDKESLYRTEKRRRALLMPWMQAGIAAAVLGLVALLLLNTRHNEGPALVKAPPVKKSAPASPSVRTAPEKEDLPVVAKTTPDKNQSRTVTTATPASLYSSGRRKNAPSPAQKETDVTIRPEEVALATTKISDSQNSETPPEVTPDAGQKTLVKSTVVEVNIPKEQSSFATQALMQEAQADETKESLAAAPAGKNKLRGIFRRVSRTFGKTADRDNNGQKEVLISAFQVALK